MLQYGTAFPLSTNGVGDADEKPNGIANGIGRGVFGFARKPVLFLFKPGYKARSS